jgi:MoxR-like ATPase
MQIDEIRDIASNIKVNVKKVIVGQDEAIDLLIIGLLSEGHLLLEGVPGVAKTLLAQTFSACVDLNFSRIQFTPDLMPGDVLGTNIYSFEDSAFHLTKGPVFTDILLADEVNRTPPKTQAALLQAMHEREVSIDGTTYDLGAGFMVIATQNPIEHQGTYPLPEAQLDRFLFKLVLDYPEREEERAIVARHGHRAVMPSVQEFGLETVCNLETIQAMRARIGEVRLEDEVLDYIVDIVRATREHPSIRIGASPRCGAMMARSCRAVAALDGRDYVVPDDVKAIAVPVFSHRLGLAPSAEIEGQQVSAIVRQILEQVSAPR